MSELKFQKRGIPGEFETSSDSSIVFIVLEADIVFVTVDCVVLEYDLRKLLGSTFMIVSPETFAIIIGLHKDFREYGNNDEDEASNDGLDLVLVLVLTFDNTVVGACLGVLQRL